MSISHGGASALVTTRCRRPWVTGSFPWSVYVCWSWRLILQLIMNEWSYISTSLYTFMASIKTTLPLPTDGIRSWWLWTRLSQT